MGPRHDQQFSSTRGWRKRWGLASLLSQGATPEQAEIFATAMHEAMGPLDDARYVIDRSAMFFKDTLLSKFMPEIIAKYIRKNQ